MTHRIVALAFVLLAAACGGPQEQNAGLDTTFGAQMASTWHYAGAPQRIQIGIFANDAQGLRPVTQGSIDVAFSFLGEGDPVPGPTATATFVPVPGSPVEGDAPTITAGASGVYEAEDVSFDRPGLWRVTLTAEIDGVARELTADFPVDAESEIPAPGMPAPETETLTNGSNVRPGAIDSMADGGGEIPDPELHEITIADAVAEGRPALVLFGTPAYCESRFCGPEVTELQRLATEHPDRAVYIHVEIWKDYNSSPQVINEGAADWLLRGTAESPEMTEPWLYLIGADGTITDRWGPLFDVDEVAAALEALPPMAG
ncbi:MAG TPA: hypothetical protein VFZ75_04445 [Actinomycetota bacterium]|nr:hypothetical protein [Actinomycetota bacterium]